MKYELTLSRVIGIVVLVVTVVGFMLGKFAPLPLDGILFLLIAIAMLVP